jgi:hypothetical protein
VTSYTSLSALSVHEYSYAEHTIFIFALGPEISETSLASAILHIKGPWQYWYHTVTIFAEACNVSRQYCIFQVPHVIASDICILKTLACVKVKGLTEKFRMNTVKIPERRKWPLVKPVKRVEAEKLEHAVVHSSLLTVPLPRSRILHLYPVIVRLLKKFPVFYMERRKNTCPYRQHVGRTLLTQYWYLSTIWKVQSVLLLHWHNAEVFPECFHTVAQSCLLS